MNAEEAIPTSKRKTAAARPSMARPGADPAGLEPSVAGQRSVSDADRLMHDDVAWFGNVRSNMPPLSRRIIDRLEAVKDVYVECGRDAVLAEQFDRFLENYLARRNGGIDEARIFFLTGESGAGKSAAITRLLRGHPALQPLRFEFGLVKPCVSVKLSGFTHPRIVAERIVTEAGHPVRSRTKLGEVWDSLPSMLRTRRTFMVHVDETQHLVKQRATQEDRRKLSEAIKGAGIDAHWPVAFVLSGLPRLGDLPLYDEQIERRGYFVDFADVDLPDERVLVENILLRKAEAACLDAHDLLATDLPERVVHAARYRYARVCQVVEAALHVAFFRDRPAGGRVVKADFADAYDVHSQAYNLPEMNPFSSENWSALPKGSFVIDPERPFPDPAKSAAIRGK